MKYLKNIKKYISLIIIAAVILSVPAVSADMQQALKPQITASAFVLMDGDTGQVLLEKNMHEKMYPASITKIMTVLLALERGQLSDVITMSHDAVFSITHWNSSNIALDENEMLTLEQALYSLSIASANDASNGIAEHISGSATAFAEQMTQRAKQAGALKTNFTNAHGLPDDEHYTTAHDMARIMSDAIKNPKFLEIFSTEIYNMPPTNIQPEARQFNRRYSLISGDFTYDGVIAEKTGWTGAAGVTFAAAARRGERTLVAVVMQAAEEISRRTDTAALFDYGFNEFVPVSFSAGEIAKQNHVIDIAEGLSVNTRLSAAEDFNALILKSLSKDDIKIKYIIAADENGRLQGRALFMLETGQTSRAGTDNMFAELGEIALEINNVSRETLENAPAEYVQEYAEQRPVIFKIFEITGIGVFILLFLFLLLIIRKHIIIHTRKKRKSNGRAVHFRSNYR